MTEKMLQETIVQAGFVTPGALTAQTGVPRARWREHARTLIEHKEIMFCRLDHGGETFLSRHLLLCILAVWVEPALSDAAQELHGWLLDAGPVSTGGLRRFAQGRGGADFTAAARELQQKLCLVPLLANAMLPDEGEEFSSGFSFLWVSGEYWTEGIRRTGKYKDLEFCISEIRRLMKRSFSTREIDSLIFHGAL